MAIDPIFGNSIRNDLLTNPRRNQVNQADNAPAQPAASANAAAPAQRLPPQVLQMMQQGRETSALLSTLPGPNLSFFQPAVPPQGFGGAGQTAGGALGGQPRINAPLMEMEAQGRTASALLSPLMGQNQRAFQPPTPPVFAGPTPAGAAAQAPTAGTQAAANPLPPAGAQLLETEQTGRTTSTLLSGLMGPQQPAGFLGATGPAAGPGNVGESLTAMRAAQEVIQAVGTAAPSTADMRIASEAYQMEAQAQQQYVQGVASQGPRWEWFA